MWYMSSRIAKNSKNPEKVVHIRLGSSYYSKLANEAKKNKRSLPYMARLILESRYDSEFSEKELYKMQSVGRIYSDLENEEDIYTRDIKPIKWD